MPGRALVGRAGSCTLRLQERHVSGEHASLTWRDGRWEVRDLGSRNGTFVDGTRLEPGQPAPLRAGSRLAFGRQGDVWILEDATAPGVQAVDLQTGQVHTAHDGLLALPDEEHLVVAVHEDARGRWMAEQDGDATPVTDGQVLTAGSQAWRISLPSQLQGTAQVDHGPRIDTISLRLEVSMDEEHVSMVVLHQGLEMPLEAREHAYAILTLARARLEEADLPLSEQGWVDRDELLRMLAVDAGALNVAIYRARGQLSAAGVEGAAGLVEVRRGQRRIGLEPARLEVRRAGEG